MNGNHMNVIGAPLPPTAISNRLPEAGNGSRSLKAGSGCACSATRSDTRLALGPLSPRFLLQFGVMLPASRHR